MLFGKVKNNDALDEALDTIERLKEKVSETAEYAKGETEKLSMVNAIINSGMWEMHFDPATGQINKIVWSDEFRRMIGYRDKTDFPDTLEAWTDKLHPEDKDMVLSEFNATLADKTNRKKYDVNYRLKTKSGEYRWYRAAGNLSRDKQGVPVIFIGIFIDITEQTEQAKKLEIETQRHDAIDSTLSEGSWSMNVIGRNPSNPDNPFWWSQQFRHLLGYNDERDFPNVLNSWSDSLHPEDKQAALDAFSNHVGDYTGRTPFDVEYRLRRKDGTYRWFKAVGATVREINETLNNMSETIKIMVDKTVGINENIASQGAAMEEFNANIEELSAMSETISQISRGLTD